jgi:hypothetical protein
MDVMPVQPLRSPAGLNPLSNVVSGSSSDQRPAQPDVQERHALNKDFDRLVELCNNATKEVVAATERLEMAKQELTLAETGKDRLRSELAAVVRRFHVD